MPTIYRQYGDKVEITSWEKERGGSGKVRVSSVKEGDIDYGERRRDSLTRTYQICVRRVSSALSDFGCPGLFTFTFQGDASDVVRLSNSIRRFLLRLRVKYPGAMAIVVPELSPRRRLHAHALIFNVPLHWTSESENFREHKGNKCTNCPFSEFWGEGFVDVRETDGKYQLAYYIAKYLTKAHEEPIMRGIRLLRMSKGFPQEITVKGLMADYIYDKYNNEIPIREWERYDNILGRMTRKYYKI